MSKEGKVVGKSLYEALKEHVGHMVEVGEDEDGANVYVYCVTCGGPVISATR